MKTKTKPKIKTKRKVYAKPKPKNIPLDKNTIARLEYFAQLAELQRPAWVKPYSEWSLEILDKDGVGLVTMPATLVKKLDDAFIFDASGVAGRSGQVYGAVFKWKERPILYRSIGLPNNSPFGPHYDITLDTTSLMMGNSVNFYAFAVVLPSIPTKGYHV